MAKYTELSESQIGVVLANYGMEYRYAEHLDGGHANTSYRVDTSAGDSYTLTVLDHAGNLSADTLVRLLRHISKHGVRSTEPVPNKAGELLSTIDDRRILLKRFVAGSCYDVLPEQYLQAAGAALASVHNVPVPDWLPAGTRRLGDVAEQLHQFEDVEFATWVARRLQATRPLFDLDAESCLVHGDFFADNLVVQADGGIAVLDWETASVDTATMDLGFAVAGLARVNGSLDPSRVHALLTGYQDKRTLTSTELALLKDAAVYAGVRQAYFRYVRQHILFPNPAMFHLYREMQQFVDSIESRWAL